MRFMPNRRRFKDLSEQEVLALAISSEEDDARIYRSYAQRLRTDYPDTAKLFDGMADEEDGHRRRLIELHRARFGEVIPLIRREHVAGWYARRPVWLVENLGLERIREEATIMESEAETFYLHAASRSTDAATRKLLGDLAQAEAAHRGRADALAEKHLDEEVRDDEDARAKRQFVLTWVQPGLAGLMDGSVSTLAPIFATAFATQDTWTTFLVGLAASVGAGISMGFTEAASDDGELSGTRITVEAGLRIRYHDNHWWSGPRPSLPDPGFLDSHDHCISGRVPGAFGHRLDPEPLHGHSFPAGDVPSGARRGTRLRCGCAHRLGLIAKQLHIE
jgi:rubrerythrin